MKYTIEELKSLCEKATPGPWVFKNNLVWLPDDNFEDGIYHDDNDICHGINGEFISASRTAVPELISELEKAEKDFISLNNDALHIESARIQIEKERDALASFLEEEGICPALECGYYVKGPSCEACNGDKNKDCWLEWAKEKGE